MLVTHWTIPPCRLVVVLTALASATVCAGEPAQGEPTYRTARPPSAGPRLPSRVPAASPVWQSPRAAAPLRPPTALQPDVIEPTAAEPVAADASTPAGLARALSELLRDVIPREYEKRKDWGRKKRITTGLKTQDGGFNLKIHRRKKYVDHGVWKHYRVHMVDPENNLQVQVQNLRSLEAGQIAFTVFFSSRLDGWAQARVYNRGVHFITLSAEGDTTLRLWLDCEVGLGLEPETLLTGVEVRPRVVAARLKLEDFRLTRISKADGPLVRELGKGLRHLIEEELEGDKLVAKLNRSIDKKRDRLRFSPAELIKLQTPPQDKVETAAKTTPAEPAAR